MPFRHPAPCGEVCCRGRWVAGQEAYVRRQGSRHVAEQGMVQPGWAVPIQAELRWVAPESRGTGELRAGLVSAQAAQEQVGTAESWQAGTRRAGQACSWELCRAGRLKLPGQSGLPRAKWLGRPPLVLWMRAAVSPCKAGTAGQVPLRRRSRCHPPGSKSLQAPGFSSRAGRAGRSALA